MKNVVVLLGKSASGKTTLAKYLAENYKYDYVVNYTTRPMRENEVRGVDYHFLREDIFALSYLHELFLAKSKFRGWYYAIERNDVLEKKFPVVVADNKMIEELACSNEINPIFIYLHRDKNKRIEEQRKRGTDESEIERRMMDEDDRWKEIKEKYKLYEVDNNGEIEVTVTDILTEIANALGV